MVWYENRITDLGKRLRPLIVSVAKSTAESVGTNYAIPVSGENLTDAIKLFCGGEGVYLEDNKSTFVAGVWKAPYKFAGGDVTFSIQTTVTATGDMRCYLSGYIQRCNANRVALNSPAYSDVSVVQSGSGRTNNCILSVTSSVIEAGDFVMLQFTRDATHANDTCGAAYLIGFSVAM